MAKKSPNMVIVEHCKIKRAIFNVLFCSVFNNNVLSEEYTLVSLSLLPVDSIIRCRCVVALSSTWSEWWTYEGISGRPTLPLTITVDIRHREVGRL